MARFVSLVLVDAQEKEKLGNKGVPSPPALCIYRQESTVLIKPVDQHI